MDGRHRRRRQLAGVRRPLTGWRRPRRGVLTRRHPAACSSATPPVATTTVRPTPSCSTSSASASGPAASPCWPVLPRVWCGSARKVPLHAPGAGRRRCSASPPWPPWRSSWSCLAWSAPGADGPLVANAQRLRRAGHGQGSPHPGPGALGLAHRRWAIPRLLSARRAPRNRLAHRCRRDHHHGLHHGGGDRPGPHGAPVPEELPPEATPARILTGYDLPPELVPSSWLTVWRIDWLWLAIIIFLAFAYLKGRHTLRQRATAGRCCGPCPGSQPRGAVLHHLRCTCRLWRGALLHAHGRAHGPDDGGALLPGARHSTTLALKALPSRTDGTRGPASGCWRASTRSSRNW